MKLIVTISFLIALFAFGAHALRPVRMFLEPCTYAIPLEQLRKTAKNVTYTLSEISKLIKGNKDDVLKAQLQMSISVKAIDTAVNNLESLSSRYEDCCQSLQSVYGSYHHRTMFTEDADFDEVVDSYRANTLKSFTPAAPHYKIMYTVLSDQQGQMDSFLQKLLNHNDAQHKSVLANWANAYTTIRNEREDTDRLLRSAICPKSTIFNQELQSKVGSVACAGCIPFKHSLSSVFRKRS